MTVPERRLDGERVLWAGTSGPAAGDRPRRGGRGRRRTPHGRVSLRPDGTGTVHIPGDAFSLLDISEPARVLVEAARG
jgi:hypothetical protein